MKTLLTICFASALALAARADVFTFQPSDADLGDLDHHYAYTWGVTWNLPADSQITKVTLSIKNIWDWKVESNDTLFIRLLDNPYTGIKTYLDNTNDNVVQDYFAGQGVKIAEFHDLKGGNAALATSPSWDFTASQIATLTSYLTNYNPSGRADFGLSFDPDCHYFNDGIKLTITTSKVPDGGLTVMLFGLGLLALARFRRVLS